MRNILSPVSSLGLLHMTTKDIKIKPQKIREGKNPNNLSCIKPMSGVGLRIWQGLSSWCSC